MLTFRAEKCFLRITRCQQYIWFFEVFGLININFRLRLDASDPLPSLSHQPKPGSGTSTVYTKLRGSHQVTSPHQVTPHRSDSPLRRTDTLNPSSPPPPQPPPATMVMYESKEKDLEADMSAAEGFCAAVRKLPPVSHVASPSPARDSSPRVLHRLPRAPSASLTVG